MVDLKKFSFLILFILITCTIFSLIGSVSAADYNVTSWTTQNDINNWMKSSSTVKGDSLVFIENKYDLSDTIVITKSINIKSSTNTQINFYQSKAMFNINSTGVTFSGLTLNHNANGKNKDSRISTMEFTGTKTVNIANSNFNLNGNYLSATSFGNWVGNVHNCRINGNGVDNFGFTTENWNGNIYNSVFIMNKNNANAIGVLSVWTGSIVNTQIFLKGKQSIGIMASSWQGGLSNVTINADETDSFGIFVDKWRGTFSKSNIQANQYNSIGIHSFDSAGTISNCVVSAKGGYAILVSKNVKVISTQASSKKGIANVYFFGPKLKLGVVSKKLNSRVYSINVHNIGELRSKSAKLTIFYGKNKKTFKVKAIKSGNFVTVKVVLPAKFATKKYLKYVRLNYVDVFGKKIATKKSKFKF